MPSLNYHRKNIISFTKHSMQNLLVPQFLLQRIVQLVMENFELYEKEMFEKMVGEINEKLKLYPHSDYESKLALLKNEFQLRVKELRDYAKWKDFNRADLPNAIEAFILVAVKNTNAQKTLQQILSQNEKFVRAEFLVKPTPRMLEIAIYRNNKTGKEMRCQELPLAIQNKLPDTLPTGFAIFSDSLSTDIDIDSIIIYTDKSKTTKPILPEAEYLQLSVGNFTKPVAYRLALVSFIENLRNEIHRLEPFALAQMKKHNKIARLEKERKFNKKALRWKGKVDSPEFNKLKDGLVKHGFIKKINGNTFKSAFRTTIETPAEIDWIGDNAMSNMLYFLYLIWSKELAIEAKQKFTVIPNCFKLGGKSIDDKQNNTFLSNLYVRMIQQTGIELDKFGANTGVLSEI